MGISLSFPALRVDLGEVHLAELLRAVREEVRGELVAVHGREVGEDLAREGLVHLDDADLGRHRIFDPTST